MMNKNTLTKTIGKIKFGAKKYAPELWLGAGLVTGTACLITTSKSSVKAVDIKANKENKLAELNELVESEEISQEEFHKEAKSCYLHFAGDMVKNYALPIGLYIATIGSVYVSYRIQKNRQVALSSALASCSLAYSSLVEKLKEGSENGLTAEEVLNGVTVTKSINEETGEEEIVKTTGVKVTNNMYKFRFDEYSPCWEKDKFQNMCTLRAEERWANDVLKCQGYIFLNDILDRLSLPKTKYGQMIGWTLDGSGYVDFGTQDCENIEGAGWDANAFELAFNCDGDILSVFGQ